MGVDAAFVLVAEVVEAKRSVVLKHSVPLEEKSAINNNSTAVVTSSRKLNVRIPEDLLLAAPRNDDLDLRELVENLVRAIVVLFTPLGNHHALWCKEEMCSSWPAIDSIIGLSWLYQGAIQT